MNKKDLFLNVLAIYGLALNLKVSNRIRENNKIFSSNQNDQDEVIISLQTSDLCENLDWNIGCVHCDDKD